MRRLVQGVDGSMAWLRGTLLSSAQLRHGCRCCATHNTGKASTPSQPSSSPVPTHATLGQMPSLLDIMGEDASMDQREAAHTPVDQPPSAMAVLRSMGIVGGDEETNKVNDAAAATTPTPTPAPPQTPYTVNIADRFGMPSDLPKGSPTTLADLLEVCPAPLRERVEKLWGDRRWSELTVVQQSMLPLAMEHRDVLCIAPTATGKTLGYVLPLMLRLTMDERMTGPTTSSVNDDEGESSEVQVDRKRVEALLTEKIASGEVCRYCELEVAAHRLCPMTGAVHPRPAGEEEMTLDRSARRAMRLEELGTVAEPKALILVPTAQLAQQVCGVCRKVYADVESRSMVRASSAEEQQRFLQALEGTDVLISSPETLLPALLKRKLSLKQVKMIVLDEVDDLVSVNHFEPLKMILGALPKGHARPQRLLVGASLPPVAYQMIKEKMLLPSHRFIIVDERRNAMGHVVAPTPARSHAMTTVAGQLTHQHSHHHLVLMVGRVEKIQKVAWLYKTGKLTSDQRTLIFCNSRHNVACVRDQLQTLVPGVHFTTLTSRSSDTGRKGVMQMFYSGVSTCLICTDILSRGIDFHKVVYVVNYDMPTEMEVFVHRSGRCGRDGMPGYVYSLFQPENVKLAKPLVAYLRQHQQLIPPTLREYAKHSFVDVFKSSLFHHPTRPYRKDDPQRSTSVMGRAMPRFPDYRQQGIHKHFRPE